ncbi:hypothetical protein [Nocardia testacea]|uniref:hypothetical protein n=1 Tax=Nocardia testacea TaxID=248551 RepID=UPI0033C95C95
MIEFTLIAAIFGAGLAFLVIATAWFAYGMAGVMTVLSLAATVVVVAIASRIVRRRDAANAEIAQEVAVANWVAQFPAEVRHVVRILTDPFQSSLLWSALGLGREPNPTRGEPGAWPTLEPCTDPADEGVWPVPVGARVRLRMLPGHAPKHYVAKLDELAVALDAEKVRVVEANGRFICLDIRTNDPLQYAQPVPVPAEPVDLSAINNGVREDGEFWLVPLLERNRLGVGVPGAGKSGFMRSDLVATAPAARDGLVVNLMIDLKFGVEAAVAKGLLHKVATSDLASVTLLQWLRWKVIETRGRQMEALGIAKHTATVDEPLYHLIIDEIAELLDNPDTRKEVLRLLVSIMRLGRALGISVSAYTQLPNKQVLGLLRDLFQIRIGMRLTSPEQIVMTYGDHHAIERGAANTTIPDRGSAGIAYVADEGSSEIIRVRAYHATDEVLAWAAQTYPPYPRPELDDESLQVPESAAGGKKKPVFDDGPVPELPDSFRDELDAALAEADELSDAIGAALAEEEAEKSPALH